MPRCQKNVKGKSGTLRRCRNDTSSGKYCWQHRGRRRRSRSQSGGGFDAAIEIAKQEKSSGGFLQSLFGGGQVGGGNQFGGQAGSVDQYLNAIRQLQSTVNDICTFKVNNVNDYRVLAQLNDKAKMYAAQISQLYGKIGILTQALEKQIAELAAGQARMRAAQERLEVTPARRQSQLDAILDKLKRDYEMKARTITENFNKQNASQIEELNRLKAAMAQMATREKNLRDQLAQLKIGMAGSQVAAQQAAKQATTVAKAQTIAAKPVVPQKPITTSLAPRPPL